MAGSNLLGRIASDAVGLSELGKIVPPSEYNKVLGDNFIMHEDGEEIYFVIKSKSDEYVFTNYGMIHVDGDNATSSKKLLKRYDYMEKRVSNVLLETAGLADLDVEIKFKFGETEFSIDITRSDLEKVKDLYKSLIEISKLQYINKIENAEAREALEFASTAVSSGKDVNLSADLVKSITNFNYHWLKNFRITELNKDFGEVFEKYINE